MDDTDTEAGYSAEVDMWLESEHGTVPLVQAAPRFVIAAVPVSLPTCEARLVILVDGKRSEHAITLVNGMSAKRAKAAISLGDSVPPF